jgi:hypothetical protein
MATMGYQLIDNNRALFLPMQDQQAIEIALFLVLVGALNGNRNDASAWLHEMVERLALTVRTHGHYQLIKRNGTAVHHAAAKATARAGAQGLPALTETRSKID